MFLEGIIRVQTQDYVVAVELTVLDIVYQVTMNTDLGFAGRLFNTSIARC